MKDLRSKLFENSAITHESLNLIQGGATGANFDCGVEQATTTKDDTEPNGGCADIAIDGQVVKHIYY